MNRAFLVLGPESSGTRLATRILISGGCQGSSEHEQPFDQFTKEDFIDIDLTIPIVWRRSVPHNSEWPHISQLLNRLNDKQVHVIVTTRDWYCMIESQLRAPHALTRDEAIRNIRSAYISIFYQVEEYNLPFTVLSYESLVARPIEVQERLLIGLGLTANAVSGIYDGNEKYLGRHE